MVIFEKEQNKICSKYTLKAKTHSFKKLSRGSMLPNPPNNAHGFTMASQHANFQI